MSVLQTMRVRRSRHGRLALALAALTLSIGTRAAAQTPEVIDGCTIVPQPGDTQVVVTTPLGTMVIELFPNAAPETVENFLGYIERGDYADTIVHRVTTPTFVIQAGGFESTGIDFRQIETQPPVPNEPCISNRAGTVAMAKFDNQPNSATSQWFVNLVDNTFLDTNNGGFTVFGRVIEGLDVALAINALTERPPNLLPSLFVVLPPSVASIFQTSPLQTPLAIQGTCFDPLDPGAVLVEDPQSPLDFEPSVTYGRPFTLVSPACATGGSGSGSPVTPCSDPGRRVMRFDPVTGALVPDGSAPFGFAEVSMTCDAIAASDAAYATHLDQIASQLDASFVRTSYTLVPEPGAPLAGAAALVVVSLLARARREARGR